MRSSHRSDRLAIGWVEAQNPTSLSLYGLRAIVSVIDLDRGAIVFISGFFSGKIELVTFQDDRSMIFRIT